jgi:hypothetical protein
MQTVANKKPVPKLKGVGRRLSRIRLTLRDLRGYIPLAVLARKTSRRGRPRGRRADVLLTRYESYLEIWPDGRVFEIRESRTPVTTSS